MRWCPLLLVLLFPSVVLATPPEFDREVAPLLVKRCLGCHSGADLKGDLDLTKKQAVLGGDDPLVRPGKLAQSLLWKRVADDEMPPKKPLSAEEKAILKQWIEAGATWGTDPINPRPSSKDWWAFQPLKAPAIPADKHPVDHFITQELQARKLKPVGLADRRTLIRRLYFDLIGLPPTPEQLTKALADTRPDATNRLVDELLASPHYGERWARHWLDVVHYGETHGYDKDQPRPHAWPYRDYVIRSLNQDKPYTRFVQEQIAGDRLFPGTVDGLVALGFLSAGPWDLIGHAEVPETKIDGKVARHLDRDDYVANTIGTFLSLTAHCAQCHDHKFDPISQQEYYSLQAVFAAIDRTNKPYDPDPKVFARRAELESQQREVEQILARITAQARQRAGQPLILLEERIAAASRPTKDLRPEYGYHSAIAKTQQSTKWVQLDLGRLAMLDHVVLYPCYDEFNGIGAGFGFPVRYKVELSASPEFRQPMLLADFTKADQSNPGTAAITVEAKGQSGRYLRITATKLAPRMNDYIFALAEVKAFDKSGSNLAAGVTVTALDSIEAPVRWRKSNLTDGHYPPSTATAEQLAAWRAEREERLKSALTAEDRAKRDTALAQQQRINQELQALPPQRMVYVGAVHTGSGTFVGTGANGGKPRPIHLLPRGDVTRPGPEVPPGVLAAIPGPFDLPPNANEADRRAALAKWLTHPDNPLLWRSIANRVWQYHFGRALVDTPNDFGRMGERPTHPQLLDYLAAYLRDQGGSLKSLHRLILSSETYRRASTDHPENTKLDANNRYFWRQNRRKLEAEAVRDSLLAVSGKLNLQMGGESYRDFVIEKPEHSPHYEYHLYDPEDPKGHRRAIYRFIVRSKPQPFLATLDCADPSFSVDKRNQTITPQQALALLNNKLTLAMARHFAKRVENEAADLNGQLTRAFQLATSREPNAAELQVLRQHAAEHGLPSTCRIILNLNEFIFVD